MNLNLKAFTLAEILITLVIVGVIACLTLPTLLSKMDKARNIATLKRAYAELSSEVKQFMIDNDCTSRLSDCSASGQFVFDFPKYLYYQRGWVDVYNVVNSGNPTLSYVNGLSLNGEKVVHLASPMSDTSLEHSYKFLAPKGAAYYLLTSGFPYDMYYWTNKRDYLRLKLDIFTNPNSVRPTRWGSSEQIHGRYPILGREIFTFFVTDTGRVIPACSQEFVGAFAYYCNYWKDNNYEYCSMTESPPVPSRAGLGCAARIIEDGWQMNY